MKTKNELIAIMDGATEPLPKEVFIEIADIAMKQDLKAQNQLFEHYGDMMLRVNPDEDTRLNVWGENHAIIHNALIELSKGSALFQSVNSIANKTGFSRKTVYKHLKQLSNVEQQAERKAVTDMNRDIVLGILMQLSIKQGDLKAMKIYLDATKGNEAAATNTTNYIQVNNIKLSVEQFQNLPTSTLDKIGSLIKEVETIEVLR